MEDVALKDIWSDLRDNVLYPTLGNVIKGAACKYLGAC